MIINVKKEKWIPITELRGECSVSSIIFDPNNILTLELDSFLLDNEVKISFHDVFAYRVTMEHFRWRGVQPVDKTKQALYCVMNSSYKDWLIKEGFDQLYGKTIPIKHYVLYCTEHIIDVLAPEGITPVILYK